MAEDLAQVRGRDLAREIRDPEDVEAGHGRPGPRSLLRFASAGGGCLELLQGEELVRPCRRQSPDTLIGERNPCVPDTSF